MENRKVEEKSEGQNDFILDGCQMSFKPRPSSSRSSVSHFHKKWTSQQTKNAPCAQPTYVRVHSANCLAQYSQDVAYANFPDTIPSPKSVPSNSSISRMNNDDNSELTALFESSVHSPDKKATVEKKHANTSSSKRNRIWKSSAYPINVNFRSSLSNLKFNPPSREDMSSAYFQKSSQDLPVITPRQVETPRIEAMKKIGNWEPKHRMATKCNSLPKLFNPSSEEADLLDHSHQNENHGGMQRWSTTNRISDRPGNENRSEMHKLTEASKVIQQWFRRLRAKQLAQKSHCLKEHDCKYKSKMKTYQTNKKGNMQSKKTYGGKTSKVYRNTAQNEESPQHFFENPRRQFSLVRRIKSDSDVLNEIESTEENESELRRCSSEDNVIGNYRGSSRPSDRTHNGTAVKGVLKSKLIHVSITNDKQCFTEHDKRNQTTGSFRSKHGEIANARNEINEKQKQQTVQKPPLPLKSKYSTTGQDISNDLVISPPSPSSSSGTKEFNVNFATDTSVDYSLVAEKNLIEEISSLKTFSTNISVTTNDEALCETHHSEKSLGYSDTPSDKLQTKCSSLTMEQLETLKDDNDDTCCNGLSTNKYNLIMGYLEDVKQLAESCEDQMANEENKSICTANVELKGKISACRMQLQNIMSEHTALVDKVKEGSAHMVEKSEELNTLLFNLETEFDQRILSVMDEPKNVADNTSQYIAKVEEKHKLLLNQIHQLHQKNIQRIVNEKEEKLKEIITELQNHANQKIKEICEHQRDSLQKRYDRRLERLKLKYERRQSHLETDLNKLLQQSTKQNQHHLQEIEKLRLQFEENRKKEVQALQAEYIRRHEDECYKHEKEVQSLKQRLDLQMHRMGHEVKSGRYQLTRDGLQTLDDNQQYINTKKMHKRTTKITAIRQETFEVNKLPPEKLPVVHKREADTDGSQSSASSTNQRKCLFCKSLTV